VKVSATFASLAALFAAPAFAADAPKADGAEVYKANCVVCHLEDGTGTMPEMSFVSGNWRHGSKIEDIVKVISAGVEGTAMVSFKERLSEDEIAAVAKYVRAFDKKAAAPEGQKPKAPAK
jgi:mono/diheme cytochrome c family protein